jgi:hypothetical protein
MPVPAAVNIGPGARAEHDAGIVGVQAEAAPEIEQGHVQQFGEGLVLRNGDAEGEGR